MTIIVGSHFCVVVLVLLLFVAIESFVQFRLLLTPSMSREEVVGEVEGVCWVGIIVIGSTLIGENLEKSITSLKFIGSEMFNISDPIFSISGIVIRRFGIEQGM